MHLDGEKLRKLRTAAKLTPAELDKRAQRALALTRMRAAGLTQAEVAARVDGGRSLAVLLSAAEAGEAVSEKAAAKIAAALGVELADLEAK